MCRTAPISKTSRNTRSKVLSLSSPKTLLKNASFKSISSTFRGKIGQGFVFWGTGLCFCSRLASRANSILCLRMEEPTIWLACLVITKQLRRNRPASLVEASLAPGTITTIWISEQTESEPNSLLDWLVRKQLSNTNTASIFWQAAPLLHYRSIIGD